MKKILRFFILILIFVLITLAACDSGAGPDNGANAPENAAGGDADPGSDSDSDSNIAPEAEIKENLPDINFNGREFRIIVKPWGEYDVFIDEDSTDDVSFNDVVINDATYKRKMNVEDKYGVEITKIVREDVYGSVRRAVGAGTDEYELALPVMPEAAKLALEGYLHDWNSLAYIDIAKPWYDQNLRGALQINGRNYFMMGDFQVRDDDHAWILMFNKKIIRDLGLEEPYQLVRDGKWTFAKFKEMIKDATVDLNGDGIYDKDDQYGFLTTSAGGVTNFLYSGGEKISDGDPADGNKPVIRANTAQVAAILEKTVDILHNDNASFIKGTWDVFEKMFINGQGLFYSEILVHVRRLRAMDADFGVLPCPKYDENQKDYLTHIDPASPIMCLPSPSDPEFTGIITEALSAESYRHVIPAFYEASLSGKIVRDEESMDMLKIIMQNHVFDMAMIFNFGDIAAVFNSLAGKGDINYASEFEKRLDKANGEIDNIWAQFEKQ